MPAISPAIAARRGPDAGLTLVEVLIVLVLVAVVGGMATLSVGRLQAGPGLHQRAETLAARLTIAAEAAAMTGQDAALVWTAGGYRFLTLRGDEWVPHNVPELGRIEALGDLVLSSGETGGDSLLIRADLTPPAEAPARIGLKAGAVAVSVLFDGLTARLASAEPTR